MISSVKANLSNQKRPFNTLKTWKLEILLHVYIKRQSSSSFLFQLKIALSHLYPLSQQYVPPLLTSLFYFSSFYCYLCLFSHLSLFLFLFFFLLSVCFSCNALYSNWSQCAQLELACRSYEVVHSVPIAHLSGKGRSYSHESNGRLDSYRI